MMYYRFWIGTGETIEKPKCADDPSLGTMEVFQYEKDLVFIWSNSLEDATKEVEEYRDKFWPGHKIRYVGWMTGNSLDQKNTGKYFDG